MVQHFEEKLINGMTAKGIREYAHRVFKQLELRFLRLPGKSCCVICATCIRFGVDQMPLARCVCDGITQ